MATSTSTFKFPIPDLSEPADGPGGYAALARAIEGRGFPKLQGQAATTKDLNVTVAGGTTYTLWTGTITPRNVIGWVDIDCYLWVTMDRDASAGTAGTLVISINGVRVAASRYHNFWKGANVPVYCSGRWMNPSAAAVSGSITVTLDSASTPTQRMLSFGMSWQEYGALMT